MDTRNDLTSIRRLRLRLLLLTATVALTGAGLHAQRDLAVVTSTVWDLASAGRSAGVVARLPDVVPPSVSPFSAMLDLGRQVPQPLDERASARGVLQARFGMEAVQEVNSGVVLADSRAVACNRLLDEAVVMDVDAGMFQTVVAAINHVTNQSVPDGAFGTCLPLVFVQPERRMRTAPGQTLKQVLTGAVSREPGSIWLAVETQEGSCTFGLVLQAKFGGACRVQLGNPVRVVGGA